MSKISRLFLHQEVLFPLAQLFIRGNSRYRFPKPWNWQICHAHKAFKLPLCTFRGKLRTFPMVKSKTIGFLLHRTKKYTPVLFWRIPRELGHTNLIFWFTSSAHRKSGSVGRNIFIYITMNLIISSWNNTTQKHYEESTWESASLDLDLVTFSTVSPLSSSEIFPRSDQKCP